MSNPLATVGSAPAFGGPGDYTYNDRFNAWLAETERAMASYRAEYAAAMAEQGISVTWAGPGDTPYSQVSPGSPTGVPPTFTAILTKDGKSTETTVSVGRAQQVDPRELATFDQNYNLKFGVQISPDPLPSDWFQNVNQWVPPPGPSTTVPIPVVSVQPQQAPPTPDAGTIVPHANPAPTGPRMESFWGWNWFYEQESGRTGPPPEQFGVNGGDLLTRDAWWSMVKDWYAGSPAVTIPTPVDPPVLITPPPTSGGGGGGTTAPPTGGTGGTTPPAATNADPGVTLGVLMSAAALIARLL